MKKAGHKLNALSNVIPDMYLLKRLILLNTGFFLSQFRYCSLFLMLELESLLLTLVLLEKDNSA